MELIKKIFFVKSAGPPKYYLGNNFHYEEKEKLWKIKCTTYANEDVQNIEEAHGTLCKKGTPSQLNKMVLSWINIHYLVNVSMYFTK